MPRLLAVSLRRDKIISSANSTLAVKIMRILSIFVAFLFCVSVVCFDLLMSLGKLLPSSVDIAVVTRTYRLPCSWAEGRLVGAPGQHSAAGLEPFEDTRIASSGQGRRGDAPSLHYAWICARLGKVPRRVWPTSVSENKHKYVDSHVFGFRAKLWAMNPSEWEDFSVSDFSTFPCLTILTFMKPVLITFRCTNCYYFQSAFTLWWRLKHIRGYAILRYILLVFDISNCPSWKQLKMGDLSREFVLCPKEISWDCSWLQTGEQRVSWERKSGSIGWREHPLKEALSQRR